MVRQRPAVQSTGPLARGLSETQVRVSIHIYQKVAGALFAEIQIAL
jgi:hypothetical protein